MTAVLRKNLNERFTLLPTCVCQVHRNIYHNPLRPGLASDTHVHGSETRKRERHEKQDHRAAADGARLATRAPGPLADESAGGRRPTADPPRERRPSRGKAQEQSVCRHCCTHAALTQQGTTRGPSRPGALPLGRAPPQQPARHPLLQARPRPLPSLARRRSTRSRCPAVGNHNASQSRGWADGAVAATRPKPRAGSW